MIGAFSLLGIIVACLYGGYLWLGSPHQNLNVLRILEALCPPSFLMMIYVDVPGTTADYVLTWAEITLLNAGLYGLIGGAISKLARSGNP
jgi:hypothetical protein